ncbi:MAG TPA: ComEC/Rec2 family competence protein [Candidatus Humimicrobiaceae bacterium]|nr:ComEC/Rec2 family competence protein [Candidatus Humimicrobiaceae bacterium]
MKKSPVFIIFGILIGLNILAWIVVYESSQPRFLEVNFFDVGQGDAIFIETPKSHQILIDGGPDSTILEKLAAEMPFWDRTIDLIVLTHPHSDHLKGLIDVLERYRVENILWSGVNYNSQLYQEWQKTIEKEGAEIYIAQAGQRVISSKAILEILYPFESFAGEETENLDNTSVSAKLVFEENSFLFTGDAYQEVELALAKELPERLKSNVLKVGHHGSRTSSAQEFVEQVLPEIAVISVGKDNSYGHPNQEVLDTLEKYDITVLRTDKDGDIKIISDGKNLKITL